MDENMLDDDKLEMDQSAYEMYHQAQTNAPCLSFDVILDDLGNNRTDFPHTCFIAAGTQSEVSNQNKLIIMKLSNLKKTLKENKESDSEDSESEDEDEDDKPELEVAALNHIGCVNRVRCTQYENIRLAATWSETGKVFIWELNEPLLAVNDSEAMTEYVKKTNASLPIFQFNGHQTEGFALDWSKLSPGQLATGDCMSNIHVWKADVNKSWNVDQRAFVGHKGSVEDIQWSPNEATVFASCSTDKSIRIWDIRAAPSKANMMTNENSHTSDVNVINWNKNEPFIASGGDDSFIKIWDLRFFTQNKPVAMLKYHSKPITSIEWNFSDSTVFAASSEDNQLTIWDLAVEKDDQMVDENDNETKNEDLADYPEQLLFVHQGQKEMKELHWHPQIPGVMISTAHTGFNIFKTISV